MVMDAQRAVRRRIETARNVEMAERLAARLRAQLDELIAATADIPLPPVREMILAALRYAAPIGLSRNEIRRAIHRDYNAEVAENTITGTLTRMHATRIVRRVGQTWFLA
jgi:hypothetical protein